MTSVDNRIAPLSRPEPVAARFFWPAAALLLAIMATLMLTTALGENQAWDEHLHLSSGYACSKGVYTFIMDHPPLAKMIAAAPLLFLDVRLPTDSGAWRGDGGQDFGIEFLYRNRIPAGRILMAGRLPMMGLSLLFGLALAWWVRRRFGAFAAVAALALYCLDPNLIAHSRYVGNDVALVAFFCLASFAAVEYLESGRTPHLLLASLLFALAIVTKFSAVALVPVLLSLYGVLWWQRPCEFPLRRLVLAVAAYAGIALLAILLVYWPETLRSLRGSAEALAQWGPPATLVGRARSVAEPWLRHPYRAGWKLLTARNRYGHPSFLLGEYSQHGWWYYFPIAFAVKSTLAALLATVAVLARAGIRTRAGRLRDVPLVWYGLVLPPTIYFAIATRSSIDVGIRHVLVVYPFLYVLAAAVLTHAQWRFARWALAAILVLQSAECAAIYPHYTAFFNVLSGGPANGPRYLVDSNNDWGQDVKKLALWLKSHGANRVYFRYFGNDQVENEGLEALAVPATDDRAGRATVDGFVAVSATYLMGVYVGHDEFLWLRQQQPVAKVGYSIYVYDLRKR